MISKRLILIIGIGVYLTFTVSKLPEAAVGDGTIIYGDTAAPTNQPKTRSYTVSSGNWGAENLLAAANTTINYVIVKASPEDDEYVAGVVTSTGPTLYVYTYSGGSWVLSWSAAVPSVSYQVFDIEYEQDSGDCLVVYSNGGITNELSYRKRVDAVWDGASTSFESNRTTGVVRFVELEPRPNSDEIALAFSDANSDLSAFIWDGTTWTSEASAALSTTLELATVRSFDVAYEAVSGDVLIAYGISATTGCGLAVKLAGQATWSNTTDEGALLDQSTAIDLNAEPGTNYIAFSSISNASLDLQLAIWDGTDTSPFNFQYTFNNADTSANTWAVPCQPVANGWAGSGTNRRAVFVYRDAAATTLPYFTWKKDTAAWEQAANTAATYSPPLVSGTKNFLFTDYAPNASDRLWVTTVDSNADLWTFTFDGATATSNWTTVDDGTGGNNAAESTLSTAVNNSGDAAFTSYDPTLIDLLSFKAQTKGNEVVITWITGSEVRTRGFRLYRTYLPQEPDSYEEITTDIIPSAGNPFSGRKYKYIDKTTAGGIYYILEEVLKNGETKRCGSVRLDDTLTFMGSTPEENQFFLSRDGKIVFEEITFSRHIKHLHKKKQKFFERHPNPLKIEISKEGIYRLTGQDLANAGWDISGINPRRLGIFNQDKQIPVYISGKENRRFDSADYIEFYGQPERTRYTTKNIYWLRLDEPALRMDVKKSSRTLSLQTTYREKTRFEENASYFPEFKGEEHWFFADEFISPYQADFYMNLDHIVPVSGPALLKISLQGGSQIGLGKDYFRQQAIIYLNDHLVGEANWLHDNEFIFNQEISSNILVEGRNKITIEAPDEGGALAQFFLLNYIEITYPRELFAREDKIIFEVDNKTPPSFRLRGFSNPQIKGFAMGEQKVVYLDNLTIKQELKGDYSVIFTAPNPDYKRYIILTENNIESPSDIYPDEPSSLKSRYNKADYIIISPSRFFKSLEPLVSLRRSQGLTTEVIDILDIYDEFNRGIFSPLAIKDFLKYAYYHWQKPEPLFVLLIGDATFDYQDFWNVGRENLVPAYLVHSPDFGETVSDNWFVDFDEDILPEMFIGRLPVKDETHLDSLVNKILTYENANPNDAWTKELLFVADNETQFEEASDKLLNLLPFDYVGEKLYLSNSTPEETRQGIIKNINSGKLILNYTGHAGVTLLSSSRIFQNSDIDLLNNDYMFPVFLTLDCLTGYFIYPEGLDSLAEVILTADKKGAIACITSSGISSIPEQKIFIEGFYKALFERENLPVVGLLHFMAMNYIYENRSLIGSDNKIENVLQTYNLLGDPALTLRKNGTPSNHFLSLRQSLQDILKE